MHIKGFVCKSHLFSAAVGQFQTIRHYPFILLDFSRRFNVPVPLAWSRGRAMLVNHALLPNLQMPLSLSAEVSVTTAEQTGEALDT